MMKLEVKGHSGCQIDVVRKDGKLFIYKSTSDKGYLDRLSLQGQKQQEAAKIGLQHIRVPQIFEIHRDDESVSIKMEYVYSKNFIEFFEQAGFEQVDYLIGALECFIEYEIGRSKLQSLPAKVFQDKFAEIKERCKLNLLFQGDITIQKILNQSEQIFHNLSEILIPVGLCHGDLTFSNILFNGNNYYLIDFLDSFIETPLQDIVKIRQDTKHRWSQLMYTKRYDAVRLHIVLDKIDREIDTYFSNKYQWYREYYPVMQLMNILRILPYAHEEKVIKYLKNTLQAVLEGLNSSIRSHGLNVEDSQTVKPSNYQKHSLLVPVAADKPEYANGLPYIFGTDKDGVIICIKSIMGLELDKFDSIYFTILKKHDEQFLIADSLNLQFKRFCIKNAKVVILDEPTVDQAETIYRTIEQEHINGSIFIKDADSFFKTDLSDNNSVAIFPIEDLEVLTPKDKSYVTVDDMYYLTNIIEKSVVGRYISAGGYYIKCVEDFRHYYNTLRGYGRLYLSHIIYAMLLDKITFRPMLVEDYKDWGTKRDWNRSSKG